MSVELKTAGPAQMPVIRTKCCGSCKHVSRESVDKGLCRESPPTVAFLVSPQGLAKMTSYPEVNLHDPGCGRYAKILIAGLGG